MRWQYDEDLVEGAVFVRASSRHGIVPPLQVRRFHSERERLYAVLDPDERNAAFFKLHLEWFREWGLEKQLAGLLDEFPLLRRSIDALAFRKARNRQEEGAELYVNEAGARTGVTALRVERFVQESALTRFLRHEWMHLQDMVDSAFGYSPRLNLPGQNAAQLRLTRERYRLLWDITIDGRLVRARRDTAGTCDSHRALFDRAFSFWEPAKRDATFSALWTAAIPAHAELLALAADPRAVRSAQRPLPGAACPLCGFPTFRWAAPPEITPSITSAIGAEFAGWLPEQGACVRCVEMYHATANHHALPAFASPAT
jgi:hypothetical protein